MAPRRSLRRWLSGWLALAILFTQIAIAGYACPVAPRSADSGTPASAEMAGMPCADMASAEVALDPQSPGLCLQHCQFGASQPAAEHAQPVFVALAALPGQPVLSPAAPPAGQALAFALRERSRDRAPPPPHSVLHCCYRI